MNRTEPSPRLPGLLVAVVLGVAGCAGPAPTDTKTTAPDAVDVNVVTAFRGDIESVLEISGSLVPQSRVGVTAKLPGRLEQVLVDLGDRVATGATLATIEQSPRSSSSPP